jgi:hypothetical protein
VLVITANRGLLPPEEPVTLRTLRAFATVDIASDDPRYKKPLLRDTKRLAEFVGDADHVVLLGSIATGKYVDTLLDVFGERLHFPAEFVGRGDMSRGGLLLRHVREGRELTYVPVVGATRRGSRPPKLSRAGRR